MNKLCLLPISLLLMHPLFSEESKDSKPSSQTHNALFDVEPDLLQELKNEIATIPSEQAAPQKEDSSKHISKKEKQKKSKHSNKHFSSSHLAQNASQNPPSVQDLPEKTSIQQPPQQSTEKLGFNTPARPSIKKGYDVWIKGDALVWQAAEDGLTYLYSGNQTRRDLHTVSFDWDWGFRLGAGYNTPKDGWDIDLSWTRIYNQAHGHQNSHSSNTLFPAWTVAANPFAGTIHHAKAHLHIHLNQIDLDLGREFYVSKSLTVRPFAGLRTDWISQHYTIHMKGVATSDASFLEQTAHLKSKFWGFGFAAGLGTEWWIKGGWALYGDAAMSLLMGFFDIDQKGSQNAVNVWSQDKNFRSGKAILDLGLGFKWATLLHDNRFGLTFKAGYEYHLYFNQNQFVASTGNTALELFNPVKGDLAYQGVTGSIQFDF